MGSSTDIYLGAYMRAPGVPKEVKEGRPQCSAKCGAAVSGKDNFCSKCGAPVEQPKAVFKNVALSMNDLFELSDKYLDMLVSPEHHANSVENESVWIPNVRGFGRNLSDDNYHTISLLKSDTESEIEKFRNKFKNIIDDLEAAYNIKVEIDYGIVVYGF